MRVLGRIFLALVVLVVLALAGIFGKAQLGMSKRWDVAATPLSVQPDSGSVARGQHLATAIMKCVECHDKDLGGRVPFADAGPLGRVNSSNLTTGRGGRIGLYDDAALARVIRHGVNIDGRSVLIMPAQEYMYASDQEIADLIAYVRSVPPVDREVPPSVIKPFGRVLYALGQFPITTAHDVDHSYKPPVSVPKDTTVAYGQYLANIGGCTGCHGPGLSGGKIPGTPPDWKPAANITPTGLKGWTQDDFVKAMKEGVRPNGTPIDTLMPWRLAGLMDSTEMRAIWLYLSSVPPKEYDNR